MSTWMLACKACLALCLCCWTGAYCLAETFLLPSDDTRAYAEFTRHLTTSLASAGNPVHILATDANLEQGKSGIGANDILVTIGTSALFRTLNVPLDTPVLAVLITSSAFNTYRHESPDAEQRIKNGKLSALFLEQPAERYLHLAVAIKPDAQSIGSVTGPLASDTLGSLNAKARSLDRNIRYLQINEKDNPTTAIQQVMQISDVYLALPDSVLFNRGTAKWVLLAGLKWRVPIIGFSERYAKAGAVAAIYTTPLDAARETVDGLKKMLDRKPLTLDAPHFPNSYTLSLNHTVADKLGITLPDEEQIRAIIAGMESKTP